MPHSWFEDPKNLAVRPLYHLHHFTSIGALTKKPSSNSPTWSSKIPLKFTNNLDIKQTDMICQWRLRMQKPAGHPSCSFSEQSLCFFLLGCLGFDLLCREHNLLRRNPAGVHSIRQSCFNPKTWVRTPTYDVSSIPSSVLPGWCGPGNYTSQKRLVRDMPKKDCSWDKALISRDRVSLRFLAFRGV